MKSRTLFIFLIIFALQTFGQEEEQFVDKAFLIIASTKNIDLAFSIASSASEKTGLPFRDNGLQYNKTTGATFPADTCEAAGFEYPCYIARGRFDDGNYLSVEYSDGYIGFQKGFYIVVAANGNINSSDLKQTLKTVQQIYPKSYIKQTQVYLGCIH